MGDLASFHDFAVEKYNISRSSKWISFGGSCEIVFKTARFVVSYLSSPGADPGMMASWCVCHAVGAGVQYRVPSCCVSCLWSRARLKLPNVFFAAIANSAPVQAVVDFPGYNDVVADSMSAPIVGGSSECLAAIATGHAQVGNLLQSAEGQGTLATLFNLCNATALSWELNQADWAGNGVINLPVQSNDPACTQLGCNISSVCQMMLDTSKGDELHRLAYVSSVQYGGNCVNVDHNQVIASLTNTTIAGGVGRLWQYEVCSVQTRLPLLRLSQLVALALQTCAQFGFYQTCVDDRCPYTKGLNTLKYNTDLCQIAFNIRHVMYTGLSSSCVSSTWFIRAQRPHY